MIVFDPGVLMGSTCQSVFDEYVEMHPGAVNLKKLHGRDCKCGKPGCFRHFLQDRVCQYVGNDKDKFCDLLNKVAEADGLEATEQALREFLGHSMRQGGKGLLSSWLTNFKSL